MKTMRPTALLCLFVRVRTQAIQAQTMKFRSDVDQLSMEEGVVFWGMERDDQLVGVMGIQDRGEVHLIRHAYVATRARRQDIGARLLQHLESTEARPTLVGTWATAGWAVAFYQKNGYGLISEAEKNRLLRRYWRSDRLRRRWCWPTSAGWMLTKMHPRSVDGPRRSKTLLGSGRVSRTKRQ